jgi:hypothetical protein
MSWFLSMLDSFNWKLCTTVLLIAAFALWSWFGLLKGDERLNLSNFVFNLFKQKLSIKIGD